MQLSPLPDVLRDTGGRFLFALTYNEANFSVAGRPLARLVGRAVLQGTTTPTSRRRTILAQIIHFPHASDLCGHNMQWASNDFRADWQFCQLAGADDVPTLGRHKLKGMSLRIFALCDLFHIRERYKPYHNPDFTRSSIQLKASAAHRGQGEREKMVSRKRMDIRTIGRSFPLGALVVSLLCGAGSASAADVIAGRVLGGGAPIANSTVALWAATADAPKQLAQTKTDESGRFEINADEMQSDAVLYLVATGGEPKAHGSGDNPAIALMTVAGSKPPRHVVINEMTTLASVITHSQFIDGIAIKGSALALRIAAGNVPSFVDLETGGYGTTIQDALNSSQTPTMANFATLSNVLAGLRHAGEVRCLQQSLLRGDDSNRHLPERHSNGS